MKTITTIILLTISLVFPASLLTADSSTIQLIDVLWGNIANPEKAVPGDQKVDLTITVANIGSKPLCALVGDLHPRPGESLPITNWDSRPTLSASVGSPVQPGSITSLTYKVNVRPDVSPGVYTAELRLSYRDCTSTSDLLPQSTQTIPLNLVVYEPQRPRFIDYRWLVDGVETSVGPGTGQAFLELVFEAPAETSVANVEGWLTLPDEFGGGVVYANYLQQVPASGVFRLMFPMIVPDTVKVGEKNFGLTLTHRNKFGTLIKTEYTVQVDVGGRADVAAVIYTPSFTANSISILNYLITNNGTAPAYNVELNIRSEIPTIRVLQPVYTLGTIEPGRTTQVTVPIFIDKTTQPSLYGLSSTISYRDVYGNIRSKQFSMPFVVEENAKPGFTARASQPFIAAAHTTPVSITFTNTNPFPARDVKIALRSSSQQVVIIEGETDLFIPVIQPGQTISTELKLLATPQAGDTVIPLKASLEYKDDIGLSAAENLDINFAVTADISIKLRSLTLSPQKVQPGETVDIAGDVVNEGTGIARAVYVEIDGQPPFKVFGEPSTFIGQINPSQVAAFTLNFVVDSQAKPGTYEVNLRVVYKNGFGDEFQASRTLVYQVVERQQTSIILPQPEQSSSVNPLIVLLVVAAALAAVILIVRRRGRREAG
ncbi:MAG: hypothetical protein QXN23_01145 [Candidatus Caldarchaeum sp.]|uniref:S-layer protein n=1 Tax=Caldiarchaeum subterraneum TaxID=311458 RepID=A0A7C4I2K0_CALS0|nr:hypothetical protein [Candidatus Caldarchaeales archaeon]MDJ0273270.1 hypothetical protein [Candidatus Caldarchaeales archaeon]